MSQGSCKNQRITYLLEGSPIALARIRISKTHGHLRVWDSQKALKLISQLHIKNQHNDCPFFKPPIGIDCTFYFHIPKTNKIMHPGYYHIYRPDCDNTLKYLLDICQGIIFKEDCAVSIANCKKVYTSGKPRTEFTVYNLENYDEDY